MDKPKSKIKLFPLVLSRLGSLPYALLDGICWSENELLTVDLQVYQELQSVAASLINDRRKWVEFQKKIKLFETDFEQKYIQQQQLHRTTFYALAGNQLLQKGLLQSSPSVWEGLQRYRLQALSVYRKKERQTERSLAQYLARICTKTSPFSTFTALSLNSLSGKNEVANSTRFSTVIRINNYVLAQVEELLSAYPPLYRQLTVQVNPSMSLEGEEYVFLMNSRNIESIQRIAQNEVLEMIVTLIQQETSGRPHFEQLVLKLETAVDASIADLEAYLAQLVRLGFLNWVWPVSGTNPNWNTKLLVWVKALRDFKGKEWIIAALDQLEKATKQLPELPATESWQLVQESMKVLKDCFQKSTSQIPEAESLNEEAFVAFQNTTLSLKPEKLFFEDMQFSAEMDWSETDLNNGVQELAHLVELLLPYRMHMDQEAPLYFFKNNYNSGEELPLMQFYQEFYKHELATNTKSDSPSKTTVIDSFSLRKEQILEDRERIVKELIKHITIKPNFTVHLPLSVLHTVFTPKSKKVAVTPSPESFGALLQLQRSSNGRYKSYVDAVFTGYGKMLGRFLHLFPKEKTIQVSNWIEKLRGDALWVDNTDASFHNANAHPAFLQKVISVPGGQQDIYNQNHEVVSTKGENLLLTDLSIRLNEKEDKLLLYYKEQEVTIFNFGLEALQTRSPMYRLLSSFCTTQPDIDPLKLILMKATRQKKGTWTILPRVNVGDFLVLQRRSWFAPKLEIPLREKGESEGAYFLRVNSWKGKHELPDCVFITVSPLEIGTNDEGSNNKNANDYKPQYIDFRSPALVSHLGRELKKVSLMLKIEEMLPGKGEMLKINGREHAVELVVHWEQGS